MKLLLLPFLFFITNTISAAESVQLFTDNHFERGFQVLKPVHKKKKKSGVIRFNPTSDMPYWKLVQWGSDFDLGAIGKKSQTHSHAIQITDGAKTIIYNQDDDNFSSLIFKYDTRKEYGNRLRKKNERWAHLLIQQSFKHHPKITELKELRYQIEFKLLKSEAFKQDGWTDRLHTAQFLAFLVVQNRNKKSKGFGNFLWFGIPMYDARTRFPRSHKALDKGTGKFIFTLGEKQFTDQSAHDKKWIKIQTDLLPLIHNGLKTAWDNGFLVESQNKSDYEIRAFNIGWEIPGTYHVEMKIRNLSLKATPIE